MKDIKFCHNCKKPMEYRKKWRNNWDDVKYCGEKCRRNRPKTQKTNKVDEISKKENLDSK